MKVKVNGRQLHRGDRILLRGCEKLQTTDVTEEKDTHYDPIQQCVNVREYIRVVTTDHSILRYDQYGVHLGCEYTFLAQRPSYADRDLDIIAIL